MPKNNMKASGACRALIREFEKCRLQAYRCPADVPTIGVGHTRGVKMGDRCTVQQADVWLTEDLQDAEAAVNTLVKQPLTQQQFDALVSFTFNLGGRALGESTMLILLNTLVKQPLTQQQFDALVSFTFNLGGRALGESTMLILLNKGSFKAAAEQFDRWVYSKGVKLEGLVRRRGAEKALFLDAMRAGA